MTDAAATKPGPWTRSIDLSFGFIFVLLGLLALGWAVSGVRQVSPSARAVIFRFGAIDREHAAGLVIAWPEPIERVVLAPAPEQLVALPLARFRAAPTAGDAVLDPRRNEGYVLTGDAGPAHIEATLYYQVTEASAFVLARDRLEPALDRLFAATIAGIAAARDLDQLLVTRPEAATSAASAEGREQLRGATVAALNRRLAALEASGAGLGVRIARVDIAAALPPTLKPAFEGVLGAAQAAEQAVAQARTAAAGISQAAERTRIEILAQATATATEQVTTARARTADILSLSKHAAEVPRPPLLDRLFRDRIAAILKRAGGVTTVDPGASSRLLLPGVGK